MGAIPSLTTLPWISLNHPSIDVIQNPTTLPPYHEYYSQPYHPSMNVIQNSATLL